MMLCPLSLYIEISIDLCEWSDECELFGETILNSQYECDCYLLAECYGIDECGLGDRLERLVNGLPQCMCVCVVPVIPIDV